MKNFRTTKYFVTVLMLALLVSGCIGDPSSSSNSSYNVSGRLVDDFGEAVRDADIVLEGTKSGTQTPNENGYFTITGLQNTTTITAVKDRWNFEQKAVSRATEDLVLIGTKKATP